MGCVAWPAAPVNECAGSSKNFFLVPLPKDIIAHRFVLSGSVSLGISAPASLIKCVREGKARQSNEGIIKSLICTVEQSHHESDSTAQGMMWSRWETKQRIWDEER